MAEPLDIRRTPLWFDFLSRVAGNLLVKAAPLGTPQGLAVLPGYPNAEILQTLDFVVDQYKYYFQYRIQYIPPSAQYRAAKWKAYGKTRFEGMPEYLIGYVEIDPLVYVDPQPIQHQLASGQLMLHLMSRSVQNSRFIRLALEVHTITGLQNEVLGSLEYMRARASLPERTAELTEVVEEFRERAIPPRVCTLVGCGEFLPAVGPDHCLTHINTPPGN